MPLPNPVAQSATCRRVRRIDIVYEFGDVAREILVAPEPAPAVCEPTGYQKSGRPRRICGRRGALLPHGYTRCAAPPAAANSHSASVGSRPPSHTQNAKASYQFTQLIGSFSMLPTVSDHVALSTSHVSGPSAFPGAARFDVEIPVAGPTRARSEARRSRLAVAIRDFANDRRSDGIARR